MRKLTLCFTLVFAAVFTMMAQNDCSTFFPFEEGALMEYASYDKKGRLESTVSHKVAFVDDTDGGGLRARVETTIKDDEGDEQLTNDYEIFCSDNVISFDLISMMSPQMTQAFSNMDVTVSGDGLRLPADLEVGQELPEATTEIKAASGGMNLLTMTFNVTDRKVEAKETITTEAGTFDCFKIRYKMDSKMLITKTFEVVEWFAKGQGMIRSETYNKKGKLESSTELITYSKS